jgi:hypothetical protein
MHNYFLSARCENAEKREKAKMQLDEKERTHWIAKKWTNEMDGRLSGESKMN